MDVPFKQEIGKKKFDSVLSRVRNFNISTIFSPITFLGDLVSYLITRALQISRFFSAFLEVIRTIFIRIKNLLVSKLFWGRGDLYKFFFRSSLVLILFVWFTSSVWETPVYSSSLRADSTYVLQQKDYTLEVGSSTTPIDEDRPRDSVQEYVVQGGDTLSTIAAKFDISVSTIRWSNNLTSDYIKPGQSLKILPITGLLHKVQKGDTLASIASKYNASEQAIADVNWLDPPFNLQSGQELMVPGGEIKQVVAISKPTNGSSGSTSTSSQTTAPVNATGQFTWPALAGFISQYYSRWHKAIDIASHALPDIVAADSGTVVYSGWDTSGYGLTILIDHGNGYFTRYAHSSSLYVKTGDYVTKGQHIMKMGSTGRSTGPHLHFEIVKNGVKQNPMSYF